MFKEEDYHQATHDEPQATFRVMFSDGKILDVKTRHNDSSLVRSFVLREAETKWGGERNITGLTKLEEN